MYSRMYPGTWRSPLTRWRSPVRFGFVLTPPRPPWPVAAVAFAAAFFVLTPPPSGAGRPRLGGGVCETGPLYGLRRTKTFGNGGGSGGIPGGLPTLNASSLRPATARSYSFGLRAGSASLCSLPSFIRSTTTKCFFHQWALISLRLPSAMAVSRSRSGTSNLSAGFLNSLRAAARISSVIFSSRDMMGATVCALTPPVNTTNAEGQARLLGNVRLIDASTTWCLEKIPRAPERRLPTA
jgi:hypothetical protein